MAGKGGTSQACAACKYQRRKCVADCPLAPYFPANNQKIFQNAHRLYGVCHIMKILRKLENREDKDEAMKSVIYESDMRARFPIDGCCGIIRRLYGQLMQVVRELQYIRAQLALYREKGQNSQFIDHLHFSYSELEFGMNPSNAMLMLQHHPAGNDFPFDPNQFVMSENDKVYFESNCAQHASFNNNDETEVHDYDEIQFGIVADDTILY